MKMQLSGHTGPEVGSVLAWCAACREDTDFVVPVGLPDAGVDERACLQCGWAVLVVTEPAGSVRRGAA